MEWTLQFTNLIIVKNKFHVVGWLSLEQFLSLRADCTLLSIGNIRSSNGNRHLNRFNARYTKVLLSLAFSTRTNLITKWSKSQKYTPKKYITTARKPQRKITQDLRRFYFRNTTNSTELFLRPILLFNRTLDCLRFSLLRARFSLVLSFADRVCFFAHRRFRLSLFILY